VLELSRFLEIGAEKTTLECKACWLIVSQMPLSLRGELNLGFGHYIPVNSLAYLLIIRTSHASPPPNFLGNHQSDLGDKL